LEGFSIKDHLIFVENGRELLQLDSFLFFKIENSNLVTLK